jgi:sorbitol-specific phosphotransferase system component IIBC
MSPFADHVCDIDIMSPIIDRHAVVAVEDMVVVEREIGSCNISADSSLEC